MRKVTSLAAPFGTDAPPSSGSRGTFQSNPVVAGMFACGYATMNPFASDVAFMPENASCSAAVEPLPCTLSTSGNAVEPS